MKSLNVRSLVLGVLVAGSLAAYTYLHREAVHEFGTCPSAFGDESTELQDTEKEKGDQITLPDVALVKRFINVTKAVMPKD
jgi:hypothetical protein